MILIWPLFKLKYMDNWSSIESTFIADARMLKENLPHPGWQPYWYCGTRWDFVYPPALRYGTALLSTVFPILPARAYHLYTAILYCLGIGGVYLLFRLGSGSRRGAWMSAALVATLSPCFMFIESSRNEAAVSFWVPQRLSVLLRYGEGPHISALAMLGFALAFSFVALRAWRPKALAAAGIASALVVSNNFYGATALALFFPMVVWAIWVTHQERAIWLRAAAIAALAYGLTASWLSPSYLRMTSENLRLVADPGNPKHLVLFIVFLLVFALVSWCCVKGRRDLDWLLFLVGSFLLISVYVLGNHYLQFQVFGVPLRLMPEFDLFFLLLAADLLRRLWNRTASQDVRMLLVIAVTGLASLYASPYIRNVWSIYPREGNYKNHIEYKITEWIHANLPDARAFTTGSVRFWYNAWFNGAQVGGSSDQGLLNPVLVHPQYQLAAGDDLKLSVLWMLATGADIAIVHDKNSTEQYHDYAFPQKFASLPVLWDSGAGDRIYQVPRRFPGLARVVDSASVARLKPFAEGDSNERLREYVDVIEKGPDSPAPSRLEGMDVLRVKARVAAGQSVVVLETFDPAWRAYSGTHALPVRKDTLNFMLIDVPPGEHDLRLVFETPLENRLGYGVTLLTLCAVLYLLFGARPRRI